MGTATGRGGRGEMKPIEGYVHIKTTCVYCEEDIEIMSTETWDEQLLDCIDGKPACPECVKKHVEKEIEKGERDE
jgi:hypothetical protein